MPPQRRNNQRNRKNGRKTPYGGRGSQQRNQNNRGRGGRGGKKTRGNRGGNQRRKPKTAEDLDREMDKYWGKSEEHASKKLDSEMDDYWKTKKEGKEDSVVPAEPTDASTTVKNSDDSAQNEATKSTEVN